MAGDTLPYVTPGLLILIDGVSIGDEFFLASPAPGGVRMWMGAEVDPAHMVGTLRQMADRLEAQHGRCDCDIT